MSVPVISNRFGSPLVFLLVAVLSVMLAETLVMLVLPLFGARYADSALLDSFLLCFMVFPLLYFLMYRPLKRYIAERDAALAALEENNRLMNTLAAMRTCYIEGRSCEDLFRTMLAGLVSLSESNGGFIAEMPPDGGDKAATRLFLVFTPRANSGAGAALASPRFSEDHPLVRRVAGEGRAVILGQGSAEPLPAGLSLKSFFGLPLFSGESGGVVIGVSDRDGGYDADLIERLQPYLLACGKILRARSVEMENVKTRTELQAARDQAEDAVKLKNKFIAMVAHDLNSPLAALLLSLNYMERVKEARPGGQGARIIHQMKGTVEEMMRMIKELLDMARLQTGALVPRRSVIDVSPLVTVAIGMSIRAAYQKGVELVNDIPQGTYLFADPDLLGEVFQNLITNAVKFCHPGGRVTVRCPEGREDVIAVLDTGVGMEKELVEKLFAAGEKVSTYGTAGEKGTGLGIPLCMDIMKAHGGMMTVESEKGKGTTFYLHIPSRAAMDDTSPLRSASDTVA